MNRTSPLDNSIAVVDKTLAALRAAAPAPVVDNGPTIPPMKQSRLARLNATAVGLVADSSPAQKLIDGLSAESLRPSVKSIEGMAKAVGLIIDTFDNV